MFTSVDEIHFSIGYIIDTLHNIRGVSMITLVFQQEYMHTCYRIVVACWSSSFVNQLSPCSQL